jgi:MFS superfamily sulfate permease-like transporter
LGWIVNFISKAVMAGFITGMAIQIIAGQLSHLTGVKESPGDTFQKLWSVLSQAGSWNWTSTVIGLLAIAVIFTLQRRGGQRAGGATGQRVRTMNEIAAAAQAAQ